MKQGQLGFVNELTQFLDEHLNDGIKTCELVNGYYTYIGSLRSSDNILYIRFPAGNRGHIIVDDDNIIVDIRIYKSSGSIYVKGTDELVRQRFVGYKITYK